MTNLISLDATLSVDPLHVTFISVLHDNTCFIGFSDGETTLLQFEDRQKAIERYSCLILAREQFARLYYDQYSQFAFAGPHTAVDPRLITRIQIKPNVASPDTERAYTDCVYLRVSLNTCIDPKENPTLDVYHLSIDAAKTYADDLLEAHRVTSGDPTAAALNVVSNQ